MTSVLATVGPGARPDRRQGSGIGCTLSPLGYARLARAKSFHLRTATSSCLRPEPRR